MKGSVNSRIKTNFKYPKLFLFVPYRFLPPHSYIDGRATSPSDIAKVINESLSNYTIYDEYFKWRNLYTIEAYQPFCDICEALKNKVNKTGKKDFRQWWNGKRMQQCSVTSKNVTYKITEDNQIQ